jgi:DNA mismatch repair protein MutS
VCNSFHQYDASELQAALSKSTIWALTTRLVSGTAQRVTWWDCGTLQRLPGIRKIFDDASRTLKESGIEPAHFALSDVLNQFDPCEDELKIIESAIAEDPPATLQNTGVIKSGYSAELDGVIERSRHAREWIANLETVEKERTGIKTLKVGYNKVFGYFIEISRANAGMPT